MPSLQFGLCPRCGGDIDHVCDDPSDHEYAEGRVYTSTYVCLGCDAELTETWKVVNGEAVEVRE